MSKSQNRERDLNPSPAPNNSVSSNKYDASNQKGLGEYTMETNNTFKALTAADFALNFGSHKVEVIFNADNTKWNVIGVSEAWKSTSYANALCHLFLNTYAFQPSAGTFMRKSWDEIALTPVEEDDYGYIMGFDLPKWIKEGKVSYRKADEIEATNLYRVAYDGWLACFVRNVQWNQYEEDEPDFAGHNRNAWKIVRDLSIMRKSRDMGYNIRLVYTEREVPFFEQAFDLKVEDDGTVTKAEGGLRAKYQLWKDGNVDVLRKLINAQIVSRKVQKTAYKVTRKEEKAREKAEEEGSEYENPIVVKNTEWMPVHAVTGNPITKDELKGRSIQFVTSGQNPFTLPRIYTISADGSSDAKNGIMTPDGAYAAAKAQSCKIIFADAPATGGKPSLKGRNTPKLVK